VCDVSESGVLQRVGDVAEIGRPVHWRPRLR